MTDSQIIINIAKLEGWTSIELCNNTCASYAGIPPDGSIYGKHRQHLRNYLEDLNAMHEAEKKIVMGEQSITYLMWLNRLSCPWFATAKQRSKALLKTFNLWEDEDSNN